MELTYAWDLTNLILNAEYSSFQAKHKAESVHLISIKASQTIHVLVIFNFIVTLFFCKQLISRTEAVRFQVLIFLIQCVNTRNIQIN